MKGRVRLFVGALVSSMNLLAPAGMQAQGFEGAITMLVATAPGRPAEPVELLSRGGNVRATLESPAGPLIVLGLAAEKKTYVVIASQRTYMDVTPDLVDASQAAPSVAGSAGAGPVMVIRTDKKDTVAGYECDHVRVRTSGSNEVDVCMTRALGAFVNPLTSMPGARMTPWQQQLARDGGFPLRATMADGTVVLEVTKIEKRRVSDTQFRIPDGYVKSGRE